MVTPDRHGEGHEQRTAPTDEAPGGTLRELLRLGDPAGDGREPTADEWAAMRERIRAEVSGAEDARRGRPRAPFAGWAWAAAAASIAVAVVLLPRLLYRPDDTGTLVTGGASERGSSVAAGASGRSGRADRGSRSMQFTTPGGTRVVWTLDPGFALPDSLSAADSD